MSHDLSVSAHELTVLRTCSPSTGRRSPRHERGPDDVALLLARSESAALAMGGPCPAWDEALAVQILEKWGTHRYGAYDLGSGQLTSLMVFGGLDSLPKWESFEF